MTLYILSIKRLKLIIQDNDFKLLTKPIWNKIKPIFTSWASLLAFVIAWMITNGWSYIFVIVGSIFKLRWMVITGTSYLAFLWMPFTPEKVITIPLSYGIYKLLRRKK